MPVDAVFHESFDRLDPGRWREVEVKGKTVYIVEEQEREHVLKASSRSSASILLAPVRIDPKDAPWLSWRWRVDQVAEGESLAHKRGSDASARVYVYFETPGLLWQKRNVDYVWSAKLPVDSMLPSAFSRSSMMIVAESGAKQLGRWHQVVRNVREDYQRCFRDAPPLIIGIGVMTDTDNTRSEAVAYYDDLMLTRQPPASTP